MKSYPALVLFVYALISCTPTITEMTPEKRYPTYYYLCKNQQTVTPLKIALR